MRTRAAAPEDADAIAALLAVREAVDGREALSEHKALRRGDGSSREVVAVDEGGGVVGYAHAAHYGGAGDGAGTWQVELVPAAGAGEEEVASALFEDVLGRLPAGEARAVWVWREPERRAAEALGLEVVRRLVQMERPLPGPPPEPVEGVELTGFRPGVDEDAWLAANNAAFAGHPEQGGWDRAELEARFAQPWFDAEGLLMAWDTSGGGLLGSCWTKVEEEGVGEIYVVGVVPGAQGRGVGRYLVLAGLDDMAIRRGCHTATLYTDPDDAAARLYERLGFRVTFEKRVYR